MRHAADCELLEADITGLGHAGDGIAQIPGGRLFVPFTVPGDRVALRPPPEGQRAGMVRLLSAGEGRAAPVCAHFGACGGCALQHLKPEVYGAFKRDRVVQALRQRGFADPPVGPAVVVEPGTRRRAALSALRTARGAVHLGFAERGSRRIADLSECPVMLPALQALFAPLREVLARLLPAGRRADLLLTATETGIEFVFRPDRAPALADRECLAAFAEHHGLARVVWGSEIVVERAYPSIRFGGVPVALTPAPFLQATASGEAALVAVARAAAQGARRIADLFAGSGSFALPLSDAAQVDAFDSDEDAIAALTRAAAAARRPVKAARRDLFRRPLEPAELDRYDMAVLDPPYAGARAQAERLAASRVPCVVMASCNPATFARDARILADAGYRLEAVTPIDQFLWSAEVELAAVLRKDG